MSITSGTHYYGPGQSLVDLSAVASQINGQTLIGDVTFILTGSLILNSVIDFASVNIGGHVLRFTSDNTIGGNPAIGHKIISDTLANKITFTSVSMTSGYVELDNIYFYTSGNGSYFMQIDSTGEFRLHDSLLEKTSNVSDGGVTFTSGLTFKAYNLKMWSYTSDCSFISTALASSATVQFENITHYATNSGFMRLNYVTSGANKWIKNCVSYPQNLNTPCFQGTVSGISNASKDNSTSAHTSSFSSITTDHFYSLLDSNSYFLDLVSTSFLTSAGTAPGISNNTFGIKGNYRPGDSYYSIGADEYAVVDMRFVTNKSSGPVPYYFRLTDVSLVSAYTSASDYTRIWSIQNSRTSDIEYLTVTSASVDYCVSADTLLNDTYIVSLSAVI